MALRNENFSSFRQIDDGLNVAVDSQDCLNTEVTDINNMVFRNGYPESRSGSKLKWATPAGETNALLNLFRTRDSLGNNYCVAVYAPNFYVHDDTNNQWIKINHTYNPSSTYKTYNYGYISWASGKAQGGTGVPLPTYPADILYAGNGQEDCIKWPIIMRYLTVTTAASDTSITVDDGTYFPATGSIILQASGGSPVYLTVTSVSGNTVNISGTVGAIVASGAAVVMQLAQVTSGSNKMPRGNIFAVSQNSLCVAGQPGIGNTVSGSVTDSPEDFTNDSATDASSGWSTTVMNGIGSIIGLIDFGEYLLCTKSDGAYKLVFNANTSTVGGTVADSLTIDIYPVFSDASLGPVTNYACIKKNNDLLFATLTEGLYSLTPGNTGTITSVDPVMISADIYRLYSALNFAQSRAVSWNQFVFWSCASNVVSDTVLVLDLLKSDKKGKYV